MTTTYKIGEAAALLNLKTYVLRFWETEFAEIVPLRTEKGQRLYTDEHLALLERIRFLLHERGLTIGGARKVLAEEKERGLTYEFGRPGALPPVPGLPGAGHVEAGFAPAERPGAPGPPLADGPGDFDDPGEALCDEDEGAAEEDDDASADEPCFVGPGGRAVASAQPAQYNLPGLEELVALRAAMAADEARALNEQTRPDEPARPPLAEGAYANRGMLPLFAVAKAAFFAGRAGGGNFIGAAPRPFAPQPGMDPGVSLNEILAELEAVAGLLRGSGPL